MWQNLEGDERSKEGFFKVKENIAHSNNEGYDATEREN